MKLKTGLILSLVYGAFVIFSPGLFATNQKVNSVPGVTNGDIIDLVKQSGKFTMLLKALEETGLIDELRKEGPLTVFAPTDDAFNRMDDYELGELFKDKEYLKKLLLVHVVDERITIKEAVDRSKLTSREKEPLYVYSNESGTFVNDTKVIVANCEAKNGLVHVIDAVLYPSASSNN